MAIDLLVEGVVDELVLRATIHFLGLEVGIVYGRKGVSFVRDRAEGIAVRGDFGHHVIILADAMDIDVQCPMEACRTLVLAPPQGTLVRLAVREIEAWLLASRLELARFLRISVARVPLHSDEVLDPKQTFINLARLSPSTRIRAMIVPRQGTSAQVGTGYVDAVAEFLNSHWNAEHAALISPSFRKLKVRVVERFVG